MDKNAIRNILTIMIVVFLGLPVSAEVLGTYTTNEYFYLPAYGEFGEEAFDEYNLYMEKADNQIEANKDDIEALQTAGFLTGITGESIGDLSDVDLTGIADNKILKYNATSQKLVVADDEDTTYSEGTGITISSGTISSSITQYTDALAKSAIATEGYIKNITEENLDSLKDVPAHPEENDQILLTTYAGGVKGYKWDAVPESGNFATKSDSRISIYCDFVNGSDDTGDGSSGNPYKTLLHAWDSLPDIVIFSATIYVLSSETFSNPIFLSDKQGIITICGDSPMSPVIDGKGLTFYGVDIIVERLNFQWSVVINSSNAVFRNCEFTNGNEFIIDFNSIVSVDDCDFEDCYIGIEVRSGFLSESGNTFDNCTINVLDNTDSIRNKAEDNTFIDTTGKEEGKTLVFDDEGNLAVGNDKDTTYSAGTGMQLNGTTFNCTVTDTNTTYLAGTGMQLDGNTFNCTVVDTNTTYTAGDGLKLTGTQFSLDFKYDPSIASGEYSGIPDTGTVGEAVVFGDLLYFKWSDKKYWKARANSAATAEVVAMAVEAKSANNSCVIIRQGYVRNDSWSAFTDSIVYLSTATAGKMQSSVPDSSGDQIKRVGQAVDSKIIFFNPSQDIGEVK